MREIRDACDRNMLRNHPDDARAADVFRDSQFFLRYRQATALQRATDAAKRTSDYFDRRLQGGMIGYLDVVDTEGRNSKPNAQSYRISALETSPPYNI